MVRNISTTLALAVMACAGQAQAQAEPSNSSPAAAQPPQAEARPTSRVSLKQILTFALDHSPELGVATSRVSGARAEIDAERAVFPSDPVLSAGVGLRRNQGRSGVDYQVGLTQELDLVGKRTSRIRVAKAGLVAEQRDLDLTRWQIHQRVHALYHRSIVAKERVRAATRFAEFGDRVMQVATQRLQTGETSQLPVSLAATEVAQAKQVLLDTRARYRTIRLELAQASGWSTLSLPEPVEGLDTPQKTPAVAHLVALAKRADPALRAARARSETARLRVGAAERGAWPNPVLGVHYERESDPGGPSSHLFGGTLSFPIPLWKGTRPEQVRARAALEQARAETNREETLVETEVRRAAQQVDSSAERVLVFGKEIVPTSQKNLGLIERAFELGEIDITQVLVARERFLRMQDAALAAYEDYYEALADLEAVLGTELEQDTSHQHINSHGSQP